MKTSIIYFGYFIFTTIWFYYFCLHITSSLFYHYRHHRHDGTLKQEDCLEFIEKTQQIAVRFPFQRLV